jgi:hypothetical protein
LPEGDLRIVLTDEACSLGAEYWRPVAAFFGMASGAFAAAVPQGWTQGIRPASSSLMTFVVISS